MKQEIIGKIQKLLALATSSNENEAKLAASRAQELLVKYNLTMTEVASHDADYMRDDGQMIKRVSKRDRFINMILKEFFFVEIVMSGRRGHGTSFITLGKRHNVEIASYVRLFLARAFDEAFSNYRKESGDSVRAKESFHYGMYKGICAQLNETKAKVEQQIGLVVVADKGLVDFTQNQFNRLKSGRMNVNAGSAGAFEAGNETGRNLRIGRTIGAAGVNTGKYLK